MTKKPFVLLFIVFWLFFYFSYHADPVHPPLFKGGEPGFWFGWADQGQYRVECKVYKSLKVEPQKLFYPPLYPLLQSLGGCSANGFFLVDSILAFASFYLMILILVAFTESWTFSVLASVLSFLLPNVWSQYIVPWASNLSSVFTLAFVYYYVKGRSNGDFLKSGLLVIALQAISRPLDAFVQLLFYVPLSVHYLFQRGHSIKEKLSKAVFSWSFLACLLIGLSFLAYSYVLFGHFMPTYYSRAGAYFDLQNLFLRGSSLLLNFAAIEPTSANFNFIALNAVFVLYLFLVVPICFSLGGSLVVFLPAVQYFVYACNISVSPNALLYVNMIHYFKSAFLLAYIFAAAAGYRFWKYNGSMFVGQIRTVSVTASLVWISFLFLNVGVQDRTQILDSPGFLISKSEGKGHDITIQLSANQCDSSYCLIHTEALYPSAPASFPSEIDYLDGPRPLLAGLEFFLVPLGMTNSGVTFAFSRKLPGGTYRFHASDFYLLRSDRKLSLIRNVFPLYRVILNHLFHRW